MKRRAKDPVTGEYIEVPADMTYEQWKKQVDETHGGGTWETERKKVLNRKSDKKQLDKYRDILGNENLPKSLDAFQKLKYNNVSKWQDTKYYARHIDGRPIEYVKIDRELEKMGVQSGKACIADDGIKAYILPDTDSKREPYHIMRRMKERNITDDEVRKFKDTAIVAMSQWKGKRIAYFSVEGISIVSKTDTEWVYKTAWKKEDFDETTKKILEVCRKYVK